jgi:hypothetical protein
MDFINYIKERYKDISTKNKIIKEYNESIKCILEDMYDTLNFRPCDVDEMMELTVKLKELQEKRYKRLKELE